MTGAIFFYGFVGELTGGRLTLHLATGLLFRPEHA